MEAIAALSLACNIIQLAGIATKSVNICKEVYENGSTIEHLEYKENCSDLRNGYLVLEQSLNTSQHQQDVRTCKIARKYIDTAKQLDDELLKLDSRFFAGSSVKGFRRFGKAIKSTWKAGRVNDIKTKLDEYEKVMDSQILVGLSIYVKEMDESTRDNLIKTDQRLDAVMRKFEAGPACTKDLLVSLGENLRRIEAGLDVVNVRIDDIRTTMDFEILRKKFDDLEASLMFDDIHLRNESIKEHHEGTFKWIFEDVPNAKWSSFTHWLQGSDQLYWVFGKPGSGKSTLMDYVVQDSKERDSKVIELLARGQIMTPFTANFFFWELGISPLHKSVTGLLRSLLLQLLRGPDKQTLQKWISEQRPDLLDLSGWSEKKLVGMMQDFHAQITRLICYFIDGLDECEDRQGLLEVVKAIKCAPNVKFCASSRPERVFEVEFDTSNKLKLEDFTRVDIDAYIQSRLQPSLYAKDKSVQMQEDTARLVDDIADMAEGVFLWVSIVVRLLNDGFRNGDDIELLHRRLRHLPPKIFDLYANMWERTRDEHSFYSEDAAKYFHLVLCGEMSLVQFALANDTRLCDELLHPDNIAKFERLERPLANYDLLKIKLASRCAGLIELREITEYEEAQFINEDEYGTGGPSTEVDVEHDSKEEDESDSDIEEPKSRPFLNFERLRPISKFLLCSANERRIHQNTNVCFIHRTVSEFLRQDKRGHRLLTNYPEGFQESWTRRSKAYIVLRVVGAVDVHITDIRRFMNSHQPDPELADLSIDTKALCDIVNSNLTLFEQTYSGLVSRILGHDQDDWFKALRGRDGNDSAREARDFLEYILRATEGSPGHYEFAIRKLQNHSRGSDRDYLSRLLWWITDRSSFARPFTTLSLSKFFELFEALLKRGGDLNVCFVKRNLWIRPEFSNGIWCSATVGSPLTELIESLEQRHRQDFTEVLRAYMAQFPSKAAKCYIMTSKPDPWFCLVWAKTIYDFAGLDNYDDGLLYFDSTWCKVSQSDSHILKTLLFSQMGIEAPLRTVYAWGDSPEAKSKRARILAKAQEIYARSTTFATIQDAFASIGIDDLEWEKLTRYIYVDYDL